MAKEPAGQGEGDGGDGEHGEKVRGDIGKSGPFQVDAADALNGEAQGVGVGEELERFWHVADGGDDAGEEGQGEDEDEDVD